MVEDENPNINYWTKNHKSTMYREGIAPYQGQSLPFIQHHNTDTHLRQGNL